MKFLFLVGLLAFALANQCQTNSQATLLVNAMQQTVNFTNFGVDDKATLLEMYAAFSLIPADKVAESVYIYIADETGKILFLSNCLASSRPCSALNDTAGFHAETRAAGDNHNLMGYRFNAWTGDLTDEYNSTIGYDPRQRPWFNVEGWTAPYVYSDGTTYGDTYVVKQGTIRIAADRLFSEPCGGCLDVAFAKRQGEEVLSAPGIDSALAGITGNSEPSVDAMNAIGKALWSTFSNKIFLLTLGVGLENNQSYWIADCGVAEVGNNAECQSKKSRYVFAIRDSRVAAHSGSPEALHHYVWHTENGTRGDLIMVDSGNYYPTIRPWYLVNDGWTNEYDFFASNFKGRSYSSHKSVSGNRYVFFADHTTRDCNATVDHLECKHFSFAPAAMDGLANNSAFAGTRDSVNAFVPMFEAIYTAVSGSSHSSVIFVGWSNDDAIFYIDCRNKWAFGDVAECVTSRTRFMLMLASNGLNGNNRRHYYEMNEASGKFSVARLHSVSPSTYFPTGRPWWNVTQWLFYVFTSGSPGSSYMAKLQGDGKIGADVVGENCLGTNDGYLPGYQPRPDDGVGQCLINLPAACSAFNLQAGLFTDPMESANMNEGNCLKRVQDYHAGCGFTQQQTVTATWTNSGHSTVFPATNALGCRVTLPSCSDSSFSGTVLDQPRFAPNEHDCMMRGRVWLNYCGLSVSQDTVSVTWTPTGRTMSWGKQ